MSDTQVPSKDRVAELRHLRNLLKTGEYMGTDIMLAWIALAEYADLLERTGHEPPAVPKCPECGARPADQCGRSFMPGRCPMEGDALRAAERIAQQCELHGEQDPFTADLRTLVAAVRAAQPPGVQQDTEGLAWALQVHEDLAEYTKDNGGNMLHTRAHRALGIMFTELEKLEKTLWPLTK
jgi:hypothetical protein